MQSFATMSMQLTSGEGAVPSRGVQDGETPPVGAGLARKIAIVEDEVMVAWSLQTTAEDLGHEVIGVFASGEAALEVLAEEAADLLFIDVNLGDGIDGVETARRLRERQALAVLFITAYADAETRMRVAEEVPGAMLLRKPVLKGLLQEAITQLAETKN